ncbi:SDR family NAD(P)-dependent oxidoreductase [Streptomyces benahoarensis]|uniref:SDR family NAD(P)-dependent oxidoreductase n=1 Tax=Streptomyces benahoarensis TaxID=2595054 RepID=UPI002551DECF|nr:SDR family NAD(P)-dependent oxidoreductase [Streptomyces benahoarensis]
MLVTGAGSGIGWASSLRLVRAGYEVFAAVRTPQEAALLLREAGVDGVARLRAFPLDVTDAEACAVAVAEVGERTGGGPWGLVNADAAVVARAVEETGEEEIHRLLEVNVLAAGRLARLVLPGMRRRGEGRIVTVSSVSGRAVLPWLGWYGASRAAAAAMTHALRMETAGTGVRVVLLEHGVHLTGLLEEAAGSLERPSTVSPDFTRSYRATAAALRNRARYTPAGEPAAVHRALAVPRPAARYVVGRDARVGAALDACLPYRWGDPLKRALLGPRPVARSMARALRLPR